MQANLRSGLRLTDTLTGPTLAAANEVLRRHRLREVGEGVTVGEAISGLWLPTAVLCAVTWELTAAVEGEGVRRC